MEPFSTGSLIDERAMPQVAFLATLALVTVCAALGWLAAGWLGAIVAALALPGVALIVHAVVSVAADGRLVVTKTEEKEAE